MMIIVRAFPLGSKQDLWFQLSEKAAHLKGPDVTPLFISQHEEHDHVAVVFDAMSFDAMVPIICSQLPRLGPVKRTKTAPLLKPIFFPVPKERPEELKRYRLALKVEAKRLDSVFDTLSTLAYPPTVFPTYQAFTFGEDDILVSILSPERGPVESVVREQIMGLEGVLDSDLAYVKRNLRIASGEEWRRYRESHYLTPTTELSDEGFDWLNAAMSGAFVDEF